MIEARHDIHIKRGETYRQDFIFKYQESGEICDLTGIDIRSQVRPSKDSPILTQDITVEVFLDEGRVQLSIADEDTAKINQGFYEWDMLLTDSASGQVAYYVWGQFLVTGRVTI